MSIGTGWYVASECVGTMYVVEYDFACSLCEMVPVHCILMFIGSISLYYHYCFFVKQLSSYTTWMQS